MRQEILAKGKVEYQAITAKQVTDNLKLHSAVILMFLLY